MERQCLAMMRDARIAMISQKLQQRHLSTASLYLDTTLLSLGFDIYCISTPIIYLLLLDKLLKEGEKSVREF
jgi:hypothetical protein